MLATMGMPAARNTDSSVMAPTTAVPRASGMKLYLIYENNATGSEVRYYHMRVDY